jgi:hypothetical protein
LEVRDSLAEILFLPGNGARKMLDGGAVLTNQLGTPRGRCDEHSGKFPLVMKPKLNRPVGERNNF